MYIPENISDCISSMDTALVKMGYLFDFWIAEYMFDELPDRELAFKEGVSIKTCKWIWEYDRITCLILIIQDYLHEATTLVKKASELNRNKGADN